MSLAEFTFTDRARPFVEVGIGDTRVPVGLGRWDLSHWDDPNATWGGGEPFWVDISCDVYQLDCEFGRQRTVDRFIVGAATVVFDNTSGWADPTPLPGQPGQLTMRPGRSLRIGVDHVDHGRRILFRGIIDSITPVYDPTDNDVVTLSVIDALGEVNRVKMAGVEPPVGTNEWASTRINRILDAADWAAGHRDVQPSAVPLLATDLSGQVADLLGIAADSAGGAVFGDTEGRVAFRPRDWQTYAPSAPNDGTIGNGGNEPGYWTPSVPAVPGYLTPSVGAASTPDSVDFRIAQDVTFIGRVRLGPLTDSAAKMIASQRDAGSNVAFGFMVQNTNQLHLRVSSSGAGYTTAATGTPPAVLTPYANQWVTLAASLDLDNGASQHAITYRVLNADGTWTVLGSTRVTGVLTAGLFDSTALVRIGNQPGGTPATWDGAIESVEVWSGLDPATVAAQRPYLDAVVGNVTTPDPGPPPAKCCWVFKISGPLVEGAAAYHYVAMQNESEGQRSWALLRHENGNINMTTYSAGTAVSGAARVTPSGGVPTQADEWLAVAVDFAVAGGNQTTTVLRSLDGGATWAQASTRTDAAIVPFDANTVMRVGAGSAAGSAKFEGRIYWCELRSGLDPTGGSVLWRFDAADYQGGGGTSYVDPRGRTWTLTTAAAIVRPLLWRFDASDYVNGTAWTDPRGETWTVTSAAAVTPKIPEIPPQWVPPVPADICPTQWQRPFQRDQIATRVLLGRDSTAVVQLDDVPGQVQYGIEPFERLDLETVSDEELHDIAERQLAVRSSATMPRVRSVHIDAATADNALDLLATVDVYEPSRYRCRLEEDRGLVFDAEHFATGIRHQITPDRWEADINLDLADIYAAAGGRWDEARWNQAVWQ